MVLGNKDLEDAQLVYEMETEEMMLRNNYLARVNPMQATKFDELTPNGSYSVRQFFLSIFWSI